MSEPEPTRPDAAHNDPAAPHRAAAHRHEDRTAADTDRWQHEDPSPPDARDERGARDSAGPASGRGLPPAIAALVRAEDRLDALRRHGGELSERLEVEYLEVDPQRLVARMPVEGNRQPAGLLHGGATIALAESLGSTGAFLHGATMGKIAVGLEISASHHSSARDGWVIGTAEPIRLGRSVATYEVIVRAEDDGRRISTVRLTCFLKDG